MCIRRICLYGGPGSGKSSMASGIFFELKKLGRNVELVQEFIKPWAYEGRKPKSFQQLYIFASQLNQEDIFLANNVDAVISDSPLFMNATYSLKYNFVCTSQLLSMAAYYEEKHPGLHIFLNRGNMDYKTEGRYEKNDSEAKDMDVMIKTVLKNYVDFREVDSRDFESVMKIVKEALTS